MCSVPCRAFCLLLAWPNLLGLSVVCQCVQSLATRCFCSIFTFDARSNVLVLVVLTAVFVARNRYYFVVHMHSCFVFACV